MDAGLAYGGSAEYRDHVDALNLSPEQISLLAGIPDLVLRETTRDFCVNQAFRRDYWVKSPQLLSESEQQAALRAQRVILALPRASVLLKVSGALGEANLPIALYGTGALLNAQDDATITAARPVAARLNSAICEQALTYGVVQFLASPVTGSGVRVPRVPQLFLLARSQQLPQIEQWAEFAHTALMASVSVSASASDPTPSRVPERLELIAQARHFSEVQLPILQALGVA